MPTLFDELSWRGLVSDRTEAVPDLFARERVTAYIGFDPTASSLHVGSLLPVLGLARLQRFGHTPIAVVGGGTGMIGDPSGKSQERLLLSTEQVEANVAGIRAQLERFLDFDASAERRADRQQRRLAGDDRTCSTFLRDIGKHFTVNYMLQKESVSRRLESEDGISFTEFSYLLLQAYDFLQLFDRYGCTLQMGGSDQWGNITAGIDLIRKLRAAKAHGLVLPLLKTSTGVEVRQDRSGHRLARCGADLAVPLLPVLAQHRRSRCGVVPEVLHVSRSRGHRGARGSARRRNRSKREAQRDACERGDDARAWRRAGGAGGARVERCCSATTSRRCRSTMCSRCSTMCRRRS